MTDSSKLFDRRLYQMRRNRHAAQFHRVDFLHQEAAARLIDRLDDMAREFPLMLELGAHGNIVANQLAARPITLIQATDILPMLPQLSGHRLLCDAEKLPFADAVFDAVISLLALHHVNDLPGTLIQLRHALKEDGLLLITLPGALTLQELRSSFAYAESELTGGITPRISPFVEVRDAGGLLQRCGYALSVVDRELITLTYAHPLALMQELRMLGEANPLLARSRKPLSRALLAEIITHYQTHYCEADGRIRATIELITMTAWKPGSGQQQPAKRGSGKVDLSSAFH